jgi:uncharacterized membrane protein YeaQ/YmgE (transglycosylase-associated protein family)
MKYIVGAFWAFIFGQVLGYIGSALTGGSYNWIFVGVWSIVIGLIGAFAFSKISYGKQDDKKENA